MPRIEREKVEILLPDHFWYATAQNRFLKLWDHFTNTETPPRISAEHNTFLRGMEPKFVNKKAITLSERDQIEKIYKTYIRENR